MTYRTSNQPRKPASKAAAHISGTGTRARPVTKLRTIDEAAELFNASRARCAAS